MKFYCMFSMLPEVAITYNSNAQVACSGLGTGTYIFGVVCSPGYTVTNHSTFERSTNRHLMTSIVDYISTTVAFETKCKDYLANYIKASSSFQLPHPSLVL
jgi:hypothetical protein